MAELGVSPAFAVGREEKMAAAAADEAGTGGTAPRAGFAEAGTGQSEARSLTRCPRRALPGPPRRAVLRRHRRAAGAAAVVEDDGDVPRRAALRRHRGPGPAAGERRGLRQGGRAGGGP